MSDEQGHLASQASGPDDEAELSRAQRSVRPVGARPAARIPQGWRGSLIGLFLAITVLLAFCFFYPGSVWANLIQVLPTFVMMFGFFLLGDGFRQRVGTEEYCAKCGYQRTRGGQVATDAARCPECGHAWWGWQGTVIGQRSISWTRIAIAATCAVLWITLLLGQFHGLNTFRLVPTFGLIEAAANHRGFDNQVWDAVAKRTISPGQERELVESLLTRRKVRRLSPGAARWIEGRIAAGAVPPDQLQRYFAEMATPRLILAHGTTPKLGERFDVQVILDNDSNIFGAHQPFLHVRAITASRDAAALNLPSPTWLYPHQVSEEFAKALADRIAGPASTTPPPAITIRPTTEGTITIAAEVYLIIWPGPNAPTLTTDPSGQVIVSTGVPLFKRFDLKLDVMVPATDSKP